MSLPKKFSRRGKNYNLIKEYKNFGLYEEEQTKIRECFDRFDLNLVREMVKVD